MSDGYDVARHDFYTIQRLLMSKNGVSRKFINMK